MINISNEREVNKNMGITREELVNKIGDILWDAFVSCQDDPELFSYPDLVYMESEWEDEDYNELFKDSINTLFQKENIKMYSRNEIMNSVLEEIGSYSENSEKGVVREFPQLYENFKNMMNTVGYKVDEKL